MRALKEDHISKIIIIIDIFYILYNYLVMIEMRLLHALIILAEERSVTHAAERLYITQPAMSATLRKLRETFGDPLFVRSASGLVMTEQAEQALVQAKQIVGLMDTLEQDFSSFNPVQDPLCLQISASDFAHSVILAKIMRMLLIEAPKTKLIMHPLQLNSLEHSLDNGSIDLAILPEFLAPSGSQRRKIFEEDFVYLMRRGHPLERENLTMELLARCVHLRVVPNLSHRNNRVDRAFKAAGYVRDVRLTINSYNTAADIVAGSDLVVLYPRGMMAQLTNDFVAHEVPFVLKPVTMCLVWHPRKQTSQSHSWARKFIIQHLGLKPPTFSR